MCQTWKIIIRQIVKLLMLNKIVMHARWRKRRKENFLKHLQSYQFEPEKQSKRKDLFDADGRNGRSSDEKNRGNTNKNIRAGTNNWCLC